MRRIRHGLSAMQGHRANGAGKRVVCGRSTPVGERRAMIVDKHSDRTVKFI